MPGQILIGTPFSTQVAPLASSARPIHAEQKASARQARVLSNPCECRERNSKPDSHQGHAEAEDGVVVDGTVARESDRSPAGHGAVAPDPGGRDQYRETNANDEGHGRNGVKLADGNRSRWQTTRHPPHTEDDRHCEREEPQSHFGDGDRYQEQQTDNHEGRHVHEASQHVSRIRPSPGRRSTPEDGAVARWRYRPSRRRACRSRPVLPSPHHPPIRSAG